MSVASSLKMEKQQNVEGGGEVRGTFCVCRGGNVASSQNKQFFALPAFRPALAISLCQENTLQIHNTNILLNFLSNRK